MSSLFDDLEIKPLTSSASLGKPKSILVEKFPTVHREDHIPVTVVAPDLARGPWIAGGACLRWYQGLPVGESDIDVFCRDAKQAAEVIERIKSYNRHYVKHESNNAITFDFWETSQYVDCKWTIQVITRRYFASLVDVVENFDITVCQIGTAGHEWVLAKNTAKDIREKNLRFLQPLQPDATKRLTKYWVYGYRPVKGTLEAIQNNPDARWEFSADEDYNNAF